MESYVCSRPKGEVDDPQGVTEDVCFAVATLVCDGIGLSEDEGVAQVGKVLCALDLSSQVLHNIGVIHEHG